jgi:hypothetical protein
MKESARKNEQELVALVKESGGFAAVQFLDADPARLFADMLFRRERRDDAGIVYNKYFYKGEALRELLAKHNLDAVMLTVVSGLGKREKVYSGNLLSTLESDFNYLVMTSQIIDADNQILWEYPNFRQRILSFPSLFPLQYPDFDEAKANETDQVAVHFKTIPGITRAFDNTADSSVRKGARVSRLYRTIFSDMMSVLGPEGNWFSGKKGETPPPASTAPASATPANTTPASTPPASSSPESTPQADTPDQATPPAGK